MKVSVIIPTNKVHPYLSEAINSALEQSYSNVEVIVVNDGGGEEVVSWLSKEFHDVVVVNLSENVGPGLARNAGVKECSGDYIAFLDSDDIWLPEKIERQIGFAQKFPDTECFHCGLTTFDNDGPGSIHVDKPQLLTAKDVLFRGHVLPSSMFIKRSLFRKYHGYSDQYRVAEDYDLVLRLVEGGEKIRFLTESLVMFRRMQQGNISSGWEGILKGKVQLYKDHKHFFNSHGGLKHYINYRKSLFSECVSKSTGVTRFLFRCGAKFFSLVGVMVKNG